LAVIEQYQGSLHCRAQRFDIHADLSAHTGNQCSGLFQNGSKQVQTIDLGSSSRLGYGLSTLKTLFACCAAVYNLPTTSVRSLPYGSAYSMTEQGRGYCACFQSLFD